MIRIQADVVRRASEARSLQDLHSLIQLSIKLEHATIPPYLTAMFSLKPQSNREIWKVLHSIVIEEMLHMSIAANILNALGGEPRIYGAELIPQYPGPLPAGVGDDLIVGLTRYDRDQVKNVFMKIEEPENPLDFPVVADVEDLEYATIGQFYSIIQSSITRLADEQLPGDPRKQFTSDFFTQDQLFPIETRQNAIDAIEVIKRQGEGTPTSPAHGEGEIAHYYKFEELYHGKKLVRDNSAANGYSFSGAIIPFDPQSVHNLTPNMRSSDLPLGSEARQLANQFSSAYAKLLSGLHRTFNGEPEFFDQTIGLMFDLKLLGERLVRENDPGNPGFQIGPTFELPST